MLQMEDESMCYSSLLLLVLLVTRSASVASVLTVSVYVFITMFRFTPLPPEQALAVLRPRASVGGVLVVAHRGGSHDAPENTLAAIREAGRNGASAVQLDLSFTADGVAVLMHDETVDRTTNGSGPVCKLRFVQIRTLDAAAQHRLKDKFSVEMVPTLHEAVEECLKYQLTIFFGVRGDAEKAAAALHHLYKKYPGLHNSSIVSSFEPKVIYKMRQTDPSVITALSHQPWRLSQVENDTDQNGSRWGQILSAILDVLLDWAHHHVLWRLCGISAILVHKDSISLDYVEFWAKRGVEVVGWTVNSAVEKAFYQNGNLSSAFDPSFNATGASPQDFPYRPTQQLDNKVNDFKHKQTSWSLPDLPAPKIVFNRLNGKKYQHPAPALSTDNHHEESFTPAHEDNVRFVHEAWQEVVDDSSTQASGAQKPVQYKEETPNPNMKNFVPIDLDEWWAQRFLANIDKLS